MRVVLVGREVVDTLADLEVVDTLLVAVLDGPIGPKDWRVWRSSSLFSCCA